MSKFNRNSVPDDFTLSLVLVDALPVIAFCLNVLLIGICFKSIVFIIGSILVIVAGLAKVIWKLIVVLKHKNIWLLFIQMRILMPIGFLIMLISVWMHKNTISILPYICSFPACIFFILGIIGMICMVIFAKKLDSGNLKANWIEQITNALSQFSFFIGILLAMNI